MGRIVILDRGENLAIRNSLMNKVLIPILLTGLMFISCDLRDQPCYTLEDVTRCEGTCDLTISGKGNMKGAPWHMKIPAEGFHGRYGNEYTVDVNLDRDDLVQECEQHDLVVSWCDSMTLYIYLGCSPLKVNTTCTDISGRVQMLYADLKLYEDLAEHKTKPPPDAYSQYLVSQGQWTLLKADKEGVKETFSVTYTPNPKFVDFLKEYDLYMDYIRLDGSCSCKYVTRKEKVYYPGGMCGD